MGKVYAFSDLHGNYDLWTQIKNYLQPDDTAYCLGDCIDRGPDGMKILAEVLRHPRIEMLLGNHEDMMIKAIEEQHQDFATFDSAEYLWMCNGGQETYKQYIQEYATNKEIDIINELKRLLAFKIIINKNNQSIFLSHAGGSPEALNSAIRDKTIKHLAIWDRNHITDKWDNETYPYLYIVHGHTPTQSRYFNGEEGKIIKYADGHKINIDLGSFISGTAALLDLDTFEPIYFKTKKERK